MRWEFGPELVDQIIYAMENQEGTFYLDFEEGEVVDRQEHHDSESEAGAVSRYYELPSWRSHEGYQLMERFVAGLRNPIYRQALREALATGRGVFRQFKNALKGRPELEKLWYAFKEREMRKVVYNWFNEIRELRGLQRLEPPVEETDELILSDFSLSEGVGPWGEAIRALDREVFGELFSGIDPDGFEGLVAARSTSLPAREDSLVIRAETPSGDFAGFAWGVPQEHQLTGAPIVELLQLAVVPEFRGLGLGRALFERFLDLADRTGAARVTTRLEGARMELAAFLEEHGFRTVARTMELDMLDWQQRISPGD